MPKYKCIETIPARVFFDILENRDYQQLRPKPGEEGLDKVFATIYDKWFEKTDNAEAKAWLQTHQEIIILEYKMQILKNLLAYMVDARLPEHLWDKLIEGLKTGYGIHFDKYADTQDEIIRILNVHVGDMRFELDMLNESIKDDSKKVKFDFYAVKASIENVIMRSLDREMVLAEWIAIENSVRKIKT